MGVDFGFYALAALVIGILCYVLNYRKLQLDIPAPLVLPIIGHAHLMIGLNNEGDFVKFGPLKFLSD